MTPEESAWLRRIYDRLGSDGDSLVGVRGDDGNEIAALDNPFPIADSGEREFVPGLIAVLVEDVGDTEIYRPVDPDDGFEIRWSYAVPVTRGTDDPPVITIKLLSVADDSLVKTLYVVAAVSKRKKITAPAGTYLAVNLDIDGLVPTTFDIRLIPAP